jgi:SNF2 family DNA or RNA helicase
MHIFELLLRLRQVCNHRKLVEGNYPGGDQREGLTEKKIYKKDGACEDTASTKIDALLRELKHISKLSRSASFSSSSSSSSLTSCLVISEWPSFLEIIGDALERKSWVRQCLQLDGRMSKQQREDTLDRFEHPQQSKQSGRQSSSRRTGCGGGVSVLLLSTRAGGVGLNLVTASHVFVMEPSWNPFQEEQAIARCHRIGQTKPVHVTRFLIADTIEDKVVRLKRKKMEMAKNILVADSSNVNKKGSSRLGIDEIKAMFQ